VRLTTVGLSLLVLALAATPVRAAQSLTVSPAIIELELAPGESVIRPVTVGASGDEPIDVRFQHVDLGFDKADYSPQYIEDSEPDTVEFSTRGWFSVPEERVQVAAGKQRVLQMTIAVPDNASPGTHLGVALFTTAPATPDKPAAGATVATATRTGPVVVVSVKGGSKPKPHLDALRLPRIVAEGPLTPRLRARNRGGAHITLSGTVELRRGGRRVERIELPRQIVVPELPRVLRGTSPGKLSLGKRKLAAGKYEVRVSLRSEPGQVRITQRRTVWVVPVWMRIVAALAIAALLGATVAGVFHVRRQRSRHTGPRAGGTQTDEELDESEHEDVDEHEEFNDVEDMDTGNLVDSDDDAPRPG